MYRRPPATAARAGPEGAQARCCTGGERGTGQAELGREAGGEEGGEMIMGGEVPVGDGEHGVVGGLLPCRGVPEEQVGPAGGEEPLGGRVQPLGGRRGEERRRKEERRRHQ